MSIPSEWMHCIITVVFLHICININFLYRTGIAVIAGVLLLLVTVTGVVVLLLVMFRRKHPNKQGNSYTFITRGEDTIRL